MFMRYIFLILFSINISAQSDESVIRDIYDNSLLNGKSYEWLDYLSNPVSYTHLTLPTKA